MCPLAVNGIGVDSTDNEFYPNIVISLVIQYQLTTSQSHDPASDGLAPLSPPLPFLLYQHNILYIMAITGWMMIF
jgi:hypothetical protein